jgi:hypothetical protein
MYKAVASDVASIGGSSSSATDRFVLTGFSDSKCYVVLSSTGSASVNFAATGWHHYYMIYDGTATGDTGRVKLYIDGVKQTLTYSGTIPATISAVAGTLRINRVSNPTATFGNGQYHSVKIWENQAVAYVNRNTTTPTTYIPFCEGYGSKVFGVISGTQYTITNYSASDWVAYSGNTYICDYGCTMVRYLGNAVYVPYLTAGDSIYSGVAPVMNAAETYVERPESFWDGMIYINNGKILRQ